MVTWPPRGRIHVAHIATTLNVGGAEQILLDLSRHLPAHGIDTSVTYLKGAGPMAPEFRALGIDVKKVGLMAPVDPFVVPRLAARLRSLAPDIVHTHMYKADLHGALAARLARIRHVVSTKHAAEEARSSAPVAAVDRWLARREDQVIAVSHCMADFTAEIERVPRERITVIVNGIDLDRVRPTRARHAVRAELGASADTLLVLCTARLHYSKGHRVLMEAVSRLPPPLSRRVRLIIAGAGDERPRLERLGDTLAIDACFLGTRRDIPDLLSACDCYVLASKREGLGLALVEAMAAGCACIGTAAGAIPEVITDGVDGMLVPAGEPEALAQMIERVLTDDELRQRLRARAVSTARARFDIRRTAAEHAALYRRVLANAPHGRGAWPEEPYSQR